jgi:hypothetical protein
VLAQLDRWFDGVRQYVYTCVHVVS